MMIILSWIGVGLFGLLAFHAAFKIKQSKGAGDLNDAFTSIGGGSFTRSIWHSVRGIIWTCLLLLYGFLAVMCYMYTLGEGNGPKSNTTTTNPNSISQSQQRKIANEVATPPSQNSSESSGLPANSTQYDGDDPIIRARLGLPPKE